MSFQKTDAWFFKMSAFLIAGFILVFAVVRSFELANQGSVGLAVFALIGNSFGAVLVILFWRLRRFNCIAFIEPIALYLLYIGASFIMGSFIYFFAVSVFICSISAMYLSRRDLLLYIIFSNIVSIVFILEGIARLRLDEMAPFTEMLAKWTLMLGCEVLIFLETDFASNKKNAATRAENSFSILLNETPNMIALLDSSYRVTYISKAFTETIGLENAEVVVDCPLLLDLFNDISMKNMFIDILNQPPPYEDTRQIMLNGEARYFRVMVKAMHNETTLIELIDITPEVRAKFEAESASRSKSSFLATMSHEIRTPLNAIIGFSEILLHQQLPNDAHIDLEKIHNSGSILLGIISDILDISKIETGNLELVPVNYTFQSLINDTVHLNLIRIGSKPIIFELDLDETIPAEFFGDELRVKQILNNLLSNAFKYTSEGKVILQVHWTSLSPENERAMLEFRIQDTGQGIKREDMPKLFSQFHQLNAKANRNIEGTGLGLTITKNLAEMMGGSIEVESEYGKGSVFTIRILQDIVDPAPIGRETTENLRRFRFVDSHQQRGTIIRKRMPGCRVLVVDDVQLNLDVARGLLLPYGLSTDSVKSGQEAVDLIRSITTHDSAFRYDLIFMDHMMPGMDGIEATRLIRSIDSDYARDVPIIALTANALAGNRELFLKNGINDYLAKPIEIQKLDMMLEKWIPREKQSAYSAEDNLQVAEQRDDRVQVPVIEGVNTREGLVNTGNSLSAYRQILSVYLTDVLERIPQIKTAAETGDLALYATMVHALKSISRSIGAAGLGDMAARLEEAGKTDDRTTVAEKTGEFLAALKVQTERISSVLNGSWPAEETKEIVSLSAAQLGELKEALMGMDVEKVNKLVAEYTGLPLDKKTQDLFSGIEQDILLFDYESAAAKLDHQGI
jgi:signal transduction histidine kinase/DNA-binding response OmpR family regulator